MIYRGHRNRMFFEQGDHKVPAIQE
jgi:hypothetical protein